MIENFFIRDYESKDETEWLDLHASVMVDSYAWWIVLHKKIVFENEAIELVAFKDGKMIGFVVAEIDSDISEKDTAFVWEYGVHRDHRRNNIGRMLIDNLHKIMNEKYQINKSIWYSQDPDSQKFYEHLGMKEIGKHWQLTIEPDKDQVKSFSENNFNCQNMRGTCKYEDIEKVKSVYKVSGDNSLKAMLCIGYEYIS